MSSLVVVHREWDRIWPFAADRVQALWAAQGPVRFVRLEQHHMLPLSEAVTDLSDVTRLVALSVPITGRCLERMSMLREIRESLQSRGVQIHTQPSEGHWGPSVAEFALGLTLCSLRRIPQTYRQMITDLSPWDYEPPDHIGRPGARGQQFGDDPRFTNGTLDGKRVRIVGIGNVGSRYASYCRMLGADVSAWDPFAQEPCFHRAGARRQWHLDELLRDAEIFAPMLPLTPSTRGLITAEHIHALPPGCLVILVTRAAICDMSTFRQRVLADELALAADVFDIEPLPLDDPLLGRHNVIHTPHNAGRTKEANFRRVEMLLEQFAPVGVRWAPVEVS
jgi:phosphoglycerate dehydrogenase-like enzyme